MTSMDTMRWHVPSCKSMNTEDKDWEEVEKSEDDNGDEDDRYLLEGNLILDFVTPTPSINLPTTLAVVSVP